MSVIGMDVSVNSCSAFQIRSLLTWSMKLLPLFFLKNREKELSLMPTMRAMSGKRMSSERFAKIYAKTCCK